MRKLAKNILVISILSLVISGCVPPCPEPVIEITMVNKYVECPAPKPPTYGIFDNELHVGHLGNLEMMRLNLENSLRYNDSLENTIKCYEKQTEKPNETATAP